MRPDLRKSVIEMPRFLSKALALAAGAILALLLLEIGLRAGGIGRLSGRPIAPESALRPGTILCFGNSYTAGVGAPIGHSYCDHLKRLLDSSGRDLPVENRGVSFSNTYHVLQALRRELTRGRPGLVLIMTGEQNYANLEGFARYLSRHGKGNWLERAAILEPLRSLRLFSLLRRQLESEGAERSVYFPDIPLSDTRTLAYKWLGGLYSRSISVEALRAEESAEASAVLEKQALSPEERGSQLFPLVIARVQLLSRNDHAAALEWYRRCLEARPDHFFLPLFRDLLRMKNSNGARELLKTLKKRFPDAEKTERLIAELTDHRSWEKMSKGLKPEERLKLVQEACRWSGENEACATTLAALGASLQLPLPAVKPLIGLLRENPFGSSRASNLLLGLREQFRGSPEAQEAISRLFEELRSKFPSEPLLLAQRQESVAAWIESDLEEIAGLLRENQVPFLFQTYPPARDLSSRPADKIVRDLAQRKGYPLSDTYSYFLERLRAGTKPEDLFSDEFGRTDDHFHSAGYAALAQFLFDSIEREKLWPSPDDKPRPTH